MRKKKAVELLLVKAELAGVLEKRLLKSRNVGVVDLVWPRSGGAEESLMSEQNEKGME